jgi:hypothetical protein
MHSMNCISALIAAGVSAELISLVVADLTEARSIGAMEAIGRPREKSSAAIRQDRYRKKKAQQSVTNNGLSVTRDGDDPSLGSSPKDNIQTPTSSPIPVSSLRSESAAVEDQVKKTKKPKTGSISEVRAMLETVLSPDIAAGVIEHRQKMRAPLTALAAKGLIKDFAETKQPDAAACMMVERGWRGFRIEWWHRELQKSGQGSLSSRDQSWNDAITQFEDPRHDYEPPGFVTIEGSATAGSRDRDDFDVSRIPLLQTGR